MIATTTIYCNIACQIQPLFEQIIKLDCHGKKEKFASWIKCCKTSVG